MDRSITEVARLTGITSRALRHYDRIGLLPPSRIGANGYRHYDEAALVRLQRVLLLRGLGVGLGDVARLLDGATDAPADLRRHLDHLRRERDRLDRQIASVQHTIRTLEEGGTLMAETMFDGFDHTRYEEEVAERWGREAAERSGDWWASISPEARTAWQERLASLNADWRVAAGAGLDPAGPEAQELARRHVAWLAGIPGTPGAGGDPDPDYLRGLGEMYVADERFAANYGGATGAAFVRDALAAHAATLG
ncbi:TipAS antibiotic-recognition domain-containing protein [Herbiconiux sp. VKM Ac-1786]|uniref:MerR family transcriptional regulator n=1 Tax=Herbiconiux sp. VKM Ac-1786 TaxID=2783824 RepID=UPI00188C9FBA|nr:TipAS antibiotic-recognition domain-containing protein [Herbiconiux sp. VKM Ac-1786]MBF4572682.1 TipAS antibiotic-recognition domain-containing protein [Herbiconiux sp. VKM Ac-1786]